VLGRRLAAVVLAVGLVVAALLVRRAIDDEDDAAAPGTDSPAAGTLVLTCITELAAACRTVADERDDVEVRVEDAGATSAELAGEPDPASTWVTFAPWAEMVERDRALAGSSPAFATSEAVASSPLVLVGRDERMAPLVASCGDVTWVCLADEAGTSWTELGGEATWGVVRPGHDDPATSATGALVFASLVTAERGSTDFTAIDIEVDDALVSRLTSLERAAPRPAGGSDVLDTFLGTPQYDVVGVVQAVLEERAGSARDGLTVVPDGGRVADVVLARPASAPVPQDVATDLAAALTARGWGPPRAATPGEGLPSADVVIALQRDVWEQVT
jgi:hypothetical protein